MRNARKVLLFAVMAFAAMAVASATASAAVSFKNEAAGANCGAVTVAGTNVTQVAPSCQIHATGEAELRKHVFGVESHITRCHNEYWGRVNGTGSGQIFEQVLTNDPGFPVCARQPCDDNVTKEGSPWPAVGVEGAPTTAGQPEVFAEYLETTFCVFDKVSGGADESCTIQVGFNETATTHKYEFGHEPAAGVEGDLPGEGISGFKCEIIGHWTTETGGTHDGAAENAVEFVHP
jgi:hypothetical protein